MKKATLPLFVVLMLPFVLFAQGTQPRQVYGPWQYNQEKGYHYRKFEYKAEPADTAYKHEYVIYYKADPKKQINNNWVYFYNPTTEKYWARYPTTNHPQYGKDAKAGREVWSVLPTQHRQKDLYAIEQKHWPTPPANYCPTVPTSSDNINLMSPPSDLP
jgi:hypothetical protein